MTKWIIFFFALFLLGCTQFQEDVIIETQKEIVEDIAPSQENIKQPLENSEIRTLEIPISVEATCNEYCSKTIGAVQYYITETNNTYYCTCEDVLRYNLNTLEIEFDQKEEDRFKDNFPQQKDHWTHMPLTYKILNKEQCGTYESSKIKRGFDKIQKATNNTVSFKETTEEADIELRCSFIENCYKFEIDIDREAGTISKSESICAHKRGIARIIKKVDEKILKAEIELIGLAGFAETSRKGTSGFYIGSCGHATTEIHEILHTFGYGHNQDPNSVMYFQEDSVSLTLQKPGDCMGSNKPIDDYIIQDLIDTYS